MAQSTLDPMVADPDAGALDAAAHLRAERLLVWRHCLLQPSFKIGKIGFTGITNAVTTTIQGAEPYSTFLLAGERYRMSIGVPDRLIAAGLRAYGSPANYAAMADEDGRLVVEHVFADAVDQIGKLLGDAMQITRSMRRLPASTGIDDYQFTIVSDAGDAFVCAVTLHGEIEPRVIERLAPFSSRDEKNVADALDVRIGPILLEREDVARLKPGQVIDCGVQPSDTIRGMLMRSDARFWPGHIEDTGIHVTGRLRPIEFDKARKLDSVLVTLGFADATLGALDRMKLKEGGFVALARHAHNHVRIFANDRAIGEGRLVIQDGNLGARLETVDFSS